MARKKAEKYANREGHKNWGNVQQMGEHLERLRSVNGYLSPPMVVEDARDPSSPTHNAFEWDDTAAAERYRLEQARYLLRAIVILREPTNGDPKQVRAFVNVRETEGGPIYTSINIAMGDPAMRQAVLQQAWRELEGWRQRYSEYQELSHVFEVIESAPIAKAG